MHFIRLLFSLMSIAWLPKKICINYWTIFLKRLMGMTWHLTVIINFRNCDLVLWSSASSITVDSNSSEKNENLEVITSFETPDMWNAVKMVSKHIRSIQPKLHAMEIGLSNVSLVGSNSRKCLPTKMLRIIVFGTGGRDSLLFVIFFINEMHLELVYRVGTCVTIFQIEWLFIELKEHMVPFEIRFACLSQYLATKSARMPVRSIEASKCNYKRK